MFSIFYTKVQNENDLEILIFRSDHACEFKNEPIEFFFVKNRTFIMISLVTSNGVVEQKSGYLQEMTSTMIHETNLTKNFLRRSLNTT